MIDRKRKLFLLCTSFVVFYGSLAWLTVIDYRIAIAVFLMIAANNNDRF